MSSTLSWGRSQPVTGNLRNAVIEICMRLDDNPDQPFIDVTNRELAASIFSTVRTIENLQDKLAAIFRTECVGGLVRYYGPSEKFSSPAKNFRQSEAPAFSPLSSPSPTPNSYMGKKREREADP